MNNLHIEKRHWDIIISILKKYPYKFYAFGSRVTGRHRKFSDLDLCYRDSIPDPVVGKIFIEFEESDLPYKVDLVNWNNCDKDFRDQIQKNLTPLFFDGGE